MAETRKIYHGQRVAGRLLEVAHSAREPILRSVEEPDGSIRVEHEGWLVTPKGARGLGLNSDGSYVRLLVDGTIRRISRRYVRYVEEVGQ